MYLFHHVDDDLQLQGVVAIPTPVDGVGPSYHGPHFEPYDLAAEQAALCVLDDTDYQIISKTLEM